MAKTDITSKAAYLLGVHEIAFNDFNHEIYLELEKNTDAKVLRSLSILRNDLFMNFKEIDASINFDLKNLNSLPKYIDQDALKFLSKNGIEVQKANTRAIEYVQIISKLINECSLTVIKNVFPIWIKHEYIKDLFNVKVENDKQVRSLLQTYKSRKFKYPYHVFTNANPDDRMYTNDKEFITYLYSLHGNEFTDVSKLKDTSLKDDFKSFLNNAGDIQVMVDCENTNVYKVYAMLEWIKLNETDMFKKIKKVELYDDIHTTSAWKLLQQFTSIKIEHALSERVKEDKSLVDIQLSAGVCKAFYQEQVKDFILISSDSDYFGLINSLPECNFQIAVERENVSGYVLEAFHECAYGFCFIDDFCTDDLEFLYARAMKLEIKEFLENKTYIDIKRLFETSARNARLNLTDEELEAYCKKYSKEIHLEREGYNLRTTINF